jgi:hypothetical protein
MAFPRKFQNLLEIERGDVPNPDYVCAISPHACGWGGWMIEAAFQNGDGGHPTTTTRLRRQGCARSGSANSTGPAICTAGAPFNPTRQRLNCGLPLPPSRHTSTWKMI